MPAIERSMRGRRMALAVRGSVLFVALAMAAPGVARDRIALPFSCTVDQGRLHVEAAAERTYPIVGHRDLEAFTYCPVWESGRCRTWMVHRFVVQCAGGRASWPEIVAAAVGRGQLRALSRASIEGGQLMLRLGARRGDVADRWCYDGDRIAGRTMPGWTRCGLGGVGGQRSAMRTQLVALPRGYAPLGILGARVLIGAEPPRPATAPPTSNLTTASLAPPVVTVEPLPPVVMPAVPVLAAAEEAGLVAPPTIEPVLPPPITPVSPHPSWRPWIEITPANAAVEEPVAVAPDGIAKLVALLLVATISLLATGALLRRRASPAAAWVERAVGLGDGEAPRAVALRTKAEGQIIQITHSLDRLATVAPLRNALARDLQASERRLAVVIAGISAARVEPDAWARARRRLERIAQDLERLRQIADSAVSSMQGMRAQTELPRNKDEAYATLGVSPGVSEPILKKLVEALRISWHPDLAGSDEDRAVRDVRIKEINVAWDLITGKRQSE